MTNSTCVVFSNLNGTQEPSFNLCLAAFRSTTPPGCPSAITWGCYSTLSMSILSILTLILILSMAMSQIIREGSMWVKIIYSFTFLEAVLYVIRYVAFPNDLLIILANTIESEVVVIVAYALTWICIELHTTHASHSNGNDSDDQTYVAVATKCVLPTLGVMALALVVTLILTFVNVLGTSETCHQLEWFFISAFRFVCVVLCTISAGLIQKNMNRMTVSESYRRNKTLLIWCIAAIFIVASVVELGNDLWAAITTNSDPNVECWKWSSISIDSNKYGNGTSMLSLRVIVRTLKFFLPMWAVVIFFRVLMPERQVLGRNRTSSWASSQQDDAWSNISGYQPNAMKRPLVLSSGSGGEDDFLRRKSTGIVGVVDHESQQSMLHPSDLLGVRRDLLREESIGSVQNFNT